MKRRMWARRRWLALALVCAVAASAAFLLNRVVFADHYSDPGGPVFLGADGRTLTVTDSPPGVEPGGLCMSSTTVDLTAKENSGSVTLQFRIGHRYGPRAMGVCANFTGFTVVLSRPLAHRAVVDGRGRPLSLVDESRLAELHDPLLLPASEGVQSAIPCSVSRYLPCGDARAVALNYGNRTGSVWTLLESVDGAPPRPLSADATRTSRVQVDGGTGMLATFAGSRALMWTRQGVGITLLTRAVGTGSVTDAQLLAEAGLVR